MNKLSRILWGIVLVAVGVVLALNALEITHINIFFDGWWTLFIIVPCGIGLFKEREKTGNLIGVAIGVLLLLCCQEVISFSLFWKLLVPCLIVFIGLKMILTGLFDNEARQIMKKLRQDGKTPKSTWAVFSGRDVNYDGGVFEGADLNAVFGGLEYDLRNAAFQEDCAIRVSAVFGGIDILVPDDINVKVSSNCIFGGVSNKTRTHQNAPTLYIGGSCLFGGIEIK